jgi:hypothetical protein
MSYNILWAFLCLLCSVISYLFGRYRREKRLEEQLTDDEKILRYIEDFEP